MCRLVEQDQAAFQAASCGNKNLSNFAKTFLQRVEWMTEIWIRATVGIEIWIGETWVMTQYCRQAWNYNGDIRASCKTHLFHIFTHNSRFGHHPQLLCVCLRCLLFFQIIQCCGLGPSLESSISFRDDAIWTLWLEADSPMDKMKQEQDFRIFVGSPDAPKLIMEIISQ